MRCNILNIQIGIDFLDKEEKELINELEKDKQVEIDLQNEREICENLNQQQKQPANSQKIDIVPVVKKEKDCQIF